MNSKNLFILLLFQAVSLSASAQNASQGVVLPINTETQTRQDDSQSSALRDLVLLVLSRHPELAKADFESRALLSRIDETRSARLPQLNLSGGYGQENQKIDLTNRANNFNDQYNLQLRLTQPLMDQTLVERMRQSRSLSLVQDWQVVATREQVILSTIELYIEMVRQFNLTQLARENLKLHRRYVGQMLEIARADLGRASDLPIAEARVSLAESVYSNRLSRLEAARVQWRAFSGLAAPEFESTNGTDWFANQLSIAPLPETLESALQGAFETNPQLQKAMAEVKTSWHGLGVSRAATAPRLNAEARTQIGNNFGGVFGTQNSWYAGVNLQWSLPANPGFSYANRAARQAMKAAESSVDITIFKIRAAVESLWYELLSSQAASTSFESYVKNADLVVKSYSEQFKIGRRSLLEVLNAENELFTARSNALTTQIDLTLISWKLLSQRGQMVQELGL